jgi:Ca2+-binding RTX toxin-like protein
MNRDLFLAILSMDSYNRGYGRGINFGPNTGQNSRNEVGLRVGNATITQQSDFLEGTPGVAAGFYALAYRVSGVAGIADGSTVIAYRGSDNIGEPSEIFERFITGNPGDDDVNSGYGVALGSPVGPQALLALRFFQSVATPQNQLNVITTGHSMGAGFAGLAAGLFGNSAALFDPMPYRDAVATVYDIMQSTFAEDEIRFATITDTGVTFGSPIIQERHRLRLQLQEEFGINSDSFSLFEDSDRTTGFFIPAHAFSLLQGGSNRLDSWRDTASLVGLDGSVAATVVELALPDDAVTTGTVRNQVGQRHAADLLVMRIYAQQLGANQQQWYNAARYFLPMLFDEELAQSVGAAQFDNTTNLPQSLGRNDFSGAMRNAIAYSALEGPNTIFGNTAIHALFNDGNDLGRLTSDYRGIASTVVGEAVFDSLGRLTVEYAGRLAINKILSSERIAALEGVLSYSYDQSPSIDQGQVISLNVNLGSAAWTFANVAFQIDERATLLEELLGSTNLVSVDLWLAGDEPNPSYRSIVDRVSEVVIAFRPNSGAFERSGSEGVVAQIGTDVETGDTFSISANTDFIIAGGGADFINAGGGRDIIIGGDGVDQIEGGDDGDWVDGGAGNDILNGGGGNDRIDGGAGIDSIRGGAGNDLIFGGYNDSADAIERIYGDQGNDYIYSNQAVADASARTEIFGGAGNDFVRAGEGVDIIDGGTGWDWVSYQDFRRPVRAHIVGTTDGYKIQVGDDLITNVENLITTGGADVFSFSGVISRGVDLMIDARGGQNLLIGSGLPAQTIDGRLYLPGSNVTSGFSLRNFASGSGYLTDVSGSGSITLIGFGTQIIGSDFDDQLYDASLEQKRIDAGSGNDLISIATIDPAQLDQFVGESQRGLVFGGDGDDIIFGSSFNDTLIGDGGSNVISGGDGADLIISGSTWSGETGFLLPYGLDVDGGGISGGNGSDYILLDDSEGGRFGSFNSFRGGQGNDYVEIKRGIYSYGFDEGDGHDVIKLQKRVWDVIADYDPQIDGFEQLDDETIVGNGLRSKEISSISTSLIDVIEFVFEVKSTTLSEYTDSSDVNGLAGIYEGDLLLKYAGGGTVLIENATAFGDFQIGANDAASNLATSFIALSPGYMGYVNPNDFLMRSFSIDVIDDGLDFVRGSIPTGLSFGPIDPIYRTAVNDFELERNPPSSQGARLINRTQAEALSSSLLVGTDDDDEFSFDEGVRTIRGEIGADTFSIVGALSNYQFTFDGPDLIIRDKWGLIGETRLVGFESVHSVSEDRAYSMDDVLAQLVQQVGAAIGGTEGNDELIGTVGNDQVSGLAGDDVIVGLRGRDRLFGNDGLDTLNGGEGDDRLDGGAGSDRMIGEFGDDHFTVDDFGDTIVEFADSGRDAVVSGVNHTLSPNVENLSLSGTATSGVGNELDNTILGQDVDNELSGAAGDDTLNGAGGNDLLYGDAGDDTVFGGAGDDTLYGGAENDSLIGGLGIDLLNAGDGDDFLDGGDEADTLIGGNGDDTYYYASNESILVENVNEGIDTVRLATSDFEYALTENFENLTSLGSTYRLSGNAADNIITGSDVDNNLYGLDGNDTLIAGSGDDYLEGNAGDDVLDGGEGIDEAYYAGAQADYIVLVLEDGTISVENIGADGEGLDILTDIELIEFADSTLYLSPPTIANEISAVSILEDSPLTISGLFAAFSDPNGGTVSYALTLSGGDPLPDWMQVDQTGLVTGQPPANFNGSIELELTATGRFGSSFQRFEIVIGAVNDAPIVNLPLPDVEQTAGIAFEIFLPLDSFADVDRDSLTLNAVLSDGSPLPEWLRFENGIFTGTAPASFIGSFQLQVSASDGLSSVSSMFDLNFSSGNRAPTISNPLVDQEQTEDRPIDFAIPLGTFSDLDGDTLTYSATQQNGDGLPAWLTFTDGRFIGTPPLNFSGSFDIAVTASDGALSVSDVFRLTITPENDPPVVLTALADISIVEDGTLDFALPLNSFSDLDGDALTLTALLSNGDPLPQWISFIEGRFTGTPPENYNGNLSVRVTASDGRQSVSDEFILSVTPQNDAPVVATPIADRSVVEDAAINFTIPSNSFSDLDGDVLSLSARLSDGSILPAWLVFSAGQFSGSPPPQFNGVFDIEVTATDGALSVSDIFRLTVSPLNDPPVVFTAIPDQTVLEDTPINFEIPQNSFSDIDGDTLTMSAFLLGGSPLPSWLVFANGRLTGAPPTNFNGNLDVEVRATDGTASVSDVFRLAITPVNDAPVALNDGLFVTTGSNPITISRIDLLANDVDPDGDPLSVTGVGNATGGAVVLDASGNIVFTPTAGFSGNGSFRYTLSDGGLTAEAVVSVRVDPASQFGGWRQGTPGSDILFGDLFEANRIFGAAGNDVITGGLYADQLAGGDGNDVLAGLSGADSFWGGNGNDTFFGGSGLDTAFYYGQRNTYSLVTQGGVLGLRVTDGQANVDGNDGTDSLSSIERLSFLGGVTVSVTSPIILDLDGNGVQTVSASDSAARYDLDDDGLADDTSWIGNTEGFLFLDRDGNGTVTDAGEFSFIDDVEDAESDLAGLRAFDSNEDGILSARDARFADFRVWQDRDGDGVAEAGEILSMTQANVRSINLTGTAVEGTTAFGDVAVINRGRYTRTNGTTMEFLDAALTYFSAATNLPDIVVQQQSLTRKANKYLINFANGAMYLTPKKTRGDIDVRAGLLSAASILNFKDKSYGLLSPIILDLDGDGIEMQSIGRARARFDMNGDGVADDTGWVGRGDGFLVIDRDGNGLITDNSELSFAGEDSEAASDLEALAALDNNGDGVLNETDVRFGELKVWVDSNGNGITDSGELKTLTELGITEIGLRGRNLEGSARVGDNILLSTATFTRSNGTTGTLGNAALAFRPGRGAAPSAVNVADDAAFPRDQISENPTLTPGETDLEAAVAALRAPTNAGWRSFGADFPIGVDPFDYFEQLGATVGIGSDGQSQSPVSIQSLATAGSPAVVQEETSGFGTIDIGAADRLLAIITQDMASFGQRSGESELSWRRGGDRITTDIFA